MTRRPPILWLLASAGLPAQAPVPPEPPNVVFFLVDDLGWKDTSLDDPKWRTPHVERLAREGMRLTTACAAAPVCTPTRAAIHTGRSPAALGITYWVLHGGRDTSAPHPTLAPPEWKTEGLQPGGPTLAGLFRAAGWRTIHAGKAHLGAVGTPGADPRNLGFDVNVAGHGAGSPGSYLGRDRFAAAARGGRKDGEASVWDVPGLDRYHGQDVYLEEALAEEACAAVRAAAAGGKRFFLHFAPYAVHVPLMANPRRLAAYGGLPPEEAAYATMIETVDAALGRILDTLDELDLGRRTLVVFTSDNGGLSAHARGGKPHVHNLPLRSGKGSAYDGGLRVPAVVRWPGVVPAGTARSEPVISTDWFPTLLAAAGIGVPPDHAARVEGLDLLPMLRGGEAVPPDRALFWHQPHFWGTAGPGIEPFSAVRRGPWKLIWFHAGGHLELYDVATDPGETRDLAAVRPDRARLLAAELAAWLDRSGAGLSVDKAARTPVRCPVPPPLVVRRSGEVPWIDLAADPARHVVVDREAGQYLGHVSTVLLDDCRTVLAVYPKGHGRGAIVLKRSEDGGRTWSARLPAPESWATSRECPSIHRVVDAAGTRRLILWSGLHPARLSTSEDDGRSWSELAPAGAWGGIVVMGSVEPLRDGPGRYLGLFHDDGRFFGPAPLRGAPMTLYRTFSSDGGRSWSAPDAIHAASEIHLCEPGCVRSPDGRRLAVLLRENRRRKRSHVIFSDDEGRTWTAPRELPPALTGDRHTGKLLPDGRLVISFRDVTVPGAFRGADADKTGEGSPTEGDWVAWIGSWSDLEAGRPGQYRLRLGDNRDGRDCAYPGVEVFPDGTVLAVTYGHWTAGEAPWIVAVRFHPGDLDAAFR